MAYKKSRPFTLDAFVKGEGADVYTHTCPNCRQKINLQTIVKSFGDPAGWIFYGEKGKRVKVCEGAIFDGTWFTHFAVQSNGKVTHRLAWEKMDNDRMG